MTVGVGDLTRTSAEPSTETWVCVIGKPDLSKVGSSSAFALIPPSTTTVAPIIEKVFAHLRSELATASARREMSSAMLRQNLLICRSTSNSTPPQQMGRISLSCVGDRFCLSVCAREIDDDHHLISEVAKYGGYAKDPNLRERRSAGATRRSTGCVTLDATLHSKETVP
jgi:hypothetical protein